MFIAALFVVAKRCRQPKCPSLEEWDWIKKMWCIYSVEYYSAIRKDKILSFATTWMDLEKIILREISHSEKANIKVEFIDKDNSMVITRRKRVGG